METLATTLLLGLLTQKIRVPKPPSRTPIIRKIVALKPGQSLESCKAMVAEHGGKIIKSLPLINAVLCEFTEEESHVSLASRPEVLDVHDDIKLTICIMEPAEEEVNKSISSPFPFPFLWPVRPIRRKTPAAQPAQQVGWNIQQIQAWPYQSTGKRVKVAVIDTGIALNHPDLKDNIKGGINVINNGASYNDDNGHGTHVAGIIGALNNEIGVVGVAPEVDLYAVKAFDSRGQGNLSDVVEGIQWCIDNDIKIVNMSFGSQEENAVFRQAFQTAARRGLIMVAAAGNEKERNSVTYPGKYSEVLAVSALTQQGTLADFSSWGKEVGIAAPGVNIRSTYLNGGYKELSGTSMAAPHVTGAVARLMAKYGNIRTSQIVPHLKRTAVWMRGLSKEQQGAGMVNVARALQRPPM